MLMFMKIFADEKSKRACEFLAREARAAGGRAYCVGGCVRDALLGVEPKDVDVEIYGLEAEKIERILSKKFRFEIVGKSFGVWILKGLDIDVSMPRTERKTGAGHKAFEIVGDPFLTPKEACARRDFTINAILYDILSGDIIDEFGGMGDLKNKILRHTSERFSEDPLRVLRAMQFAARFNLDVAPETVELCSKIEMENLPEERIFEEWKKLILKGVEISRGLFFLRDCGWVKYFRELADMAGCPQDPRWHPEGDVYVHTAHCMDSFAKKRVGDDREDLIVGLAVLCHDMGKPKCTTIGDDGAIHSYGHDVIGGKVARKFLEHLTREKSIVEEVVPLVERHMAVLDLWRSNAGDGAIRRLAGKVKRIDRLVRLDDADRNGRPPIEPEDSPQGLWIMQRAEALAIKDSAPKPILLGRHLIELGLAPSVKFKDILNAAYEAQLDGAFFDVEHAVKYAKDNLL